MGSGITPPWIWQRWMARFGEARAREYALSLNRPPAARTAPHDRMGVSENLPGNFSELVPGAFLMEGSCLVLSRLSLARGPG